jgi:transcriptional regulator with XRE-family HTH domain
MDDQRVGALLRALRIRRGLRQIDIAILAGVSDATVSRIERGQLEQLTVAVVRRVARVLEARLDLGVWTRAGDIERIATSRHAEIVDAVIEALVAAEWVARPEVSFGLRGERGFIDILAWHPPTGALLVIEVKTEIVDIGELLGTLDRKVRLAPEIARGLGFVPTSISRALVVADTHTNHRRVTAHAVTFGAVLPDDGHRFRAFVRKPLRTIASVAYWPYRHRGTSRRLGGGLRRVRRPGQPSVQAIRHANERGRSRTRASAQVQGEATGRDGPATGRDGPLVVRG